MTDDEIVGELRRVTSGVLMMSETDSPFEIVELNGERDLTPERLRELTRSAADSTVAKQSVAEFFGAAASNYPELVRLLDEELTEARVYRVGSRNVGVVIVGRAPSGNLLGVTTRVVET